MKIRESNAKVQAKQAHRAARETYQIRSVIDMEEKISNWAGLALTRGSSRPLRGLQANCR